MVYYKKRKSQLFNSKTLKKIKNIKVLLQKFSFYLVTFQFFVLLLIYIFYLSTDFSKRYKISWMLNALNSKVTKYTDIDFFEIKNLPTHLKFIARSAYFKVKSVKVKEIKISINQKNLIFLENQRKLKTKSEMYELEQDLEVKSSDGGIIDFSKFKFNAEAIYKEKKSKIKLRIKGDDQKHFNHPKKFSLRIDLRGNDRIFGLEEFSIHKPLYRNYTYELIYHKLMEHVGNLALKYGITRLYFNGEDRGLYAFEESPNIDTLESNFRKNGPIYSVDESFGQTFPEIVYKAYSEEFWIINNEDILETGYSILNNIRDNKIEISQDNFNFEKWAKFFALTDLSKTYHGLLSKSVRLYFDPVLGKFEPISFDGHKGTVRTTQKNKNFIILDLLDRDSAACENNYFCDENRVWINKFFKNYDQTNKMEFIELYIKYLKIYTEKDFIDKFLDTYDDEINNFNNAVYSEFSKRETNYGESLAYFDYDKEFLYNRAKVIRQKIEQIYLKKLNLNKVIFSIDKDKLNIFSLYYVLPFKIVSDCSYKKDSYVSLKKNKIYSLDLKDKCSFIKAVPFLGKTINIELKKNNSLANIKLYDYKKYSKLDSVLKGFYKNNIFYPSDKSVFINENLYIPKGQIIKFTKGQNIFFIENTIIYSEGDISFEGLASDPIFLEGSNFNAIIQYGKNFSAKNLIISNFNPPTFKNRIFYSGFSIIESNVNFENVFFDNIIAEDAINLINSNTSFKNVGFLNASSDAIDVDFGKFDFDKISCNNIMNDCLDVSGAIINGKNFTAINVKDKILSAGENSNVIINGFSFEDSHIGAAAKDNSIVHLSNGFFKDNTFALASFIKKRQWGPAEVYLKDVRFLDNSQNFLLGKTSKIKFNQNFINVRINDDDINNIIYPNQ